MLTRNHPRYGLTAREQQEFEARFEIQLAVAIDTCFDYWLELSPDRRRFLYAELRSALEAQLLEEVRGKVNDKGAA
jgi:hypothetical protein